MIMLAKQ